MPLIHVTRAGVLDDIGTLRPKRGTEKICVWKLDTFTMFWQWIKYYGCFFVLNLNTNWNVSRVDSSEYTLLLLLWFGSVCIISTGLFSYQLQLVSCKMKMDLFVPYRCCCCCCFFSNQSRTLLHLFQFYSISLYCI